MGARTTRGRMSGRGRTVGDRGRRRMRGEEEKIVAFGRMNVRPHKGKNIAAETFAVHTVLAQPISALLCKRTLFSLWSKAARMQFSL